MDLKFETNSFFPFTKIKNIEIKKNMDFYCTINQKKEYINKILLKQIYDTEIDTKRFNGIINKKEIKFIKPDLLKNVKKRNITYKKSKSFQKIHINQSLNSFIKTQNINCFENSIIKRNKSEIDLIGNSNEQMKFNKLALLNNKKIYIPPLDLKFKNESIIIHSNKNRTPKSHSLINIYSSMNKEIKAIKKSQSSINMIRKTLNSKLKKYEKENKNRIFNNLITERFYSMNKKIKFKYNFENDLNLLDFKIKKKKINKNLYTKIMTYEEETRNNSIKHIKENLSKQVNKWNDNVALDYIDINSKAFKLKKYKIDYKKYKLSRRNNINNNIKKQKLLSNSLFINHFYKI